MLKRLLWHIVFLGGKYLLCRLQGTPSRPTGDRYSNPLRRRRRVREDPERRQHPKTRLQALPHVLQLAGNCEFT